MLWSLIKIALFVVIVAAAALGASDIAPRSCAIVIPDPVPDGMAAGAASTDGQNASQPAGHDTRNVDIFFVGEW